MQLSTQCGACGTIKISKYVNILSTNLILSSLLSEVLQRIYILIFFFFFWGGEGEAKGGGACVESKQYARLLMSLDTP